jgi:ketosteroid isomerase-like protein
MASTSSAIEVVQSMYAAFAKGDIDSMLALVSQDVVWGEPENPYNPAAGTRRGHAGFLEWVEIGHAAEEVEELEVERLLSDDETVAAIGHIRCYVRSTGKRYESDFVHVLTVRGGLVTRFQEFFDTYAAGEAFRA